jgi:hypothetical protein
MKRSARRRLARKSARRPPASVRRASKRELDRTARLVRKSPLLRTVLDWVEGFIMVLNKHRQIVAVSDNLPEALREVDPESLVGKRPGEALNCLNADAGPGGCGTGDACRYCGSLEGILRCRSEDGPIDSECTLVEAGPEGEESRKYRVRSSRFPVADDDFTLLFFQRASERYPTPRTSPPSSKRLPPAIARFTRLRKLGTGSMGAVYLVRDPKGRLFALKTLLPEMGDDPSVVRRFRRELRIALKLDHPNVVKTHKAARGRSGLLYMVCEYCPFGSAYREMQRSGGPLPVELALHWMIGAARGIDYVWRKHRVVHRDIKPDNLLIDREYRIKITDFGIAKPTTVRSRLTQPGFAIGTPQYMPPEQGDDTLDLDVRSDLYSLGATFYHLLGGKPPFDGNSPMSVLLKVRTQDPVPLAKRRKGLPRRLTRCIDGLLAKDRDERPEDAGALLAELDALAKRLGVDPDARPETAHGGETRVLAAAAEAKPTRGIPN